MTGKKPTAGIVLAAGMSRRFGKPKQLEKLRGKPILDWTLEACFNSQLERIFLVLGHYHQEIVDSLPDKIRHPRLTVVINQNYHKGQSTSLKAGIVEIGDTFKSAMFILGDQPMINSSELNLMLSKYWVSGKNICVPFYRNVRGNPTIFSRLFYDDICSISGDVGARKIIMDHPNEVLWIELKRPSFFHDIDNEKDLEEAELILKGSK